MFVFPLCWLVFLITGETQILDCSDQKSWQSQFVSYCQTYRQATPRSQWPVLAKDRHNETFVCGLWNSVEYKLLPLTGNYVHMSPLTDIYEWLFPFLSEISVWQDSPAPILFSSTWSFNHWFFTSSISQLAIFCPIPANWHHLPQPAWKNSWQSSSRKVTIALRLDFWKA